MFVAIVERIFLRRARNAPNVVWPFVSWGPALDKSQVSVLTIMSNDVAFEVDAGQIATALSLLQEFLDPYNQLTQSTHAAFDDARLLFSEACFCLGANRCLAAAVTNGAALDSALFSARVYRRIDVGAGINDQGLLKNLQDLKWRRRQFTWKWSEKWAEHNHIKLPEQCGWAHELGDFAAHFSEKKLAEALCDPTKPYRTWVSLDDVHLAISIVRQTILRIAENWEKTD